jgi:hypothetical protein
VISLHDESEDDDEENRRAPSGRTILGNMFAGSEAGTPPYLTTRGF